MGKGTDKLYITHGEWADASFNVGSGKAAGAHGSGPGASFRRLPFNYCALSLQPFAMPACTPTGTVFDLAHILPWLKKHGANPVDGTPLRAADLVRLHFARNDAGEYVDPVSYKPLTDNSHIVALRNTGNVFSYETLHELNIKAKSWRDLVSDAEFTRADIITLQDPRNLEARDLSAFKYIQEGTGPRAAADTADAPSAETPAGTNAAKILKAKQARAERVAAQKDTTALVKPGPSAPPPKAMPAPKVVPYNAAAYSSGKAAASLTSTGMTPHTSSDRAILSDEQYMLRHKRVKAKGYARIQTNYGDLNVELQTEHAPKAVWNFVKLAKKGYYKGLAFHRNIKNFMLQGGDPTGTGRGGSSIWNKPFEDEYAQSPLAHDARGILSMANKGKNTNTSQFFITYRPAKHLDRKHTIFGRVIDNDAGEESLKTLARLEAVKTGDDDKPLDVILIENVVVFVDPFEEFLAAQAAATASERAAAVPTDDDLTTWTGKRIRADGTAAPVDGTVGKYLSENGSNGSKDAKDAKDTKDSTDAHTLEAELDDWAPPPKKRKGGFGNFDGW